jgi:divalent metal cation (Fe/Co/Zn/Cd) transporter
VTEGSKKAILAAFFANLGIAISKFVGFVITGSAGMLAEAVHSLADTGNQGLLMLGGRRAIIYIEPDLTRVLPIE